MSVLEILSGKRQGDKIELKDQEFDIGNKKSAAISIRDPWVSSKHGRIYTVNNNHIIEDLGSTNGTWINGRQIEARKPQNLRSGDLICFGMTKARFLTTTATKKATPPPKADQTIAEERDQLKRMTDVLERFLDVPANQRDQIIAATSNQQPQAIGPSSLEAERAKIAQLNHKAEKLQSSLKRSEDSERQKLRALENLQTQLESSEKDKAILEQQVKVLQDQLASFEHKNSNEPKTNQIPQSIEKATAELKKELRIKTRALEDVQREKKALSKQLKDAKAKLESTQSPENDESQQLRDQLELAKAKIAKLQAAGDAATLASLNEQLRQERDQAIQEANETRVEIDEISQENIAFEEQNAKLLAKLAELDHSLKNQ